MRERLSNGEEGESDQMLREKGKGEVCSRSLRDDKEKMVMGW